VSYIKDKAFGFAAGAADCFNRLGRRIAVDVEDNDLCPLPSIAKRDGPADTGAASGDHRAMSVEQPCHLSNLPKPAKPVLWSIVYGPSPDYLTRSVGCLECRHHVLGKPAELFLKFRRRQSFGPVDHEAVEPGIFRFERFDAGNNVRRR